jgi:hypothetical protein
MPVFGPLPKGKQDVLLIATYKDRPIIATVDIENNLYFTYLTAELRYATFQAEQVEDGLILSTTINNNTYYPGYRDVGKTKQPLVNDSEYGKFTYYYTENKELTSENAPIFVDNNLVLERVKVIDHPDKELFSVYFLYDNPEGQETATITQFRIIPTQSWGQTADQCSLGNSIDMYVNSNGKSENRGSIKTVCVNKTFSPLCNETIGCAATCYGACKSGLYCVPKGMDTLGCCGLTETDQVNTSNCPDDGADINTGLSTGAIIGIVIAVLIIVAAIVGGIIYATKKKAPVQDTESKPTKTSSDG